MLLAVVAFMPRALSGQATLVAVDMMEPLSPLRDELGRLPEVESPVQTDQVEVVPNHVSFYDSLREGHFQLWDPQHGLGTPLGTNPNMFLLSPLSLLLVAFPSWYALSLRIALLLLVAEAGTYLMARRFGVSRWLATIAGVAYAFNGANIVLIHRVNVVFLLPLFLFAIDKAVSRPSVRRLLGVGAVVAWMWLEGFPSATVQVIYLGGFWALWLLYRRARRQLSAGGLAWKDLLARAGGLGAAVLWGLAVSAVNLVYFSRFVTSIGLLDTRGQDSTGHLAPSLIYNMFSSGVYGNYHDPTDWWQGSNPVEAVSTIGAVAMVFAAGAVLMALWRRLDLTDRGRDAWPFLLGSAAFITFVAFIGTGVLGAVYSLPAMGDNPIHRLRFAIALPVVLIGALGADSFLRCGLARSSRSAPLVATAAWSALFAACFVLPARGFVAQMRASARVSEVSVALGLGLLMAAITVVILLVARRWPRLAVPAAVLVAVVVWVELALPLRHFTPEAPVEDFYPTLPIHQRLRELAGDEYRFAATGMDHYPNGATLHDLYDLRGATLRPERVKDFVELADPEAFNLDWMKHILSRDEWNLASPVYDELALKYFVVGTSMAPLGEQVVLFDGPGQPGPEARLAEPARFSLLLPANTAGVGLVATARGEGCSSAALKLTAMQGGERAESSRPAYDAVGDWIDFGLLVQGFDPRESTELVVEPTAPNCEVQVYMAGDEPAARAFVEDPEGPVHLIAVDDGWVYERPSAKPMVRAYTDWLTVPDAAAAREAFLEDPTVPSVVGTDEQPDAPGRPVELTDTELGDDEVTTTVSSDARSLLTVVQSASPGWTVTVDGQPARLVELYGGFTAVIVPAGTHRVEFAFRPTEFFVGAAVSTVAILGGVAALLFDWWWRRRRRSAGSAGHDVSEGSHDESRGQTDHRAPGTGEEEETPSSSTRVAGPAPDG